MEGNAPAAPDRSRGVPGRAGDADHVPVHHGDDTGVVATLAALAGASTAGAVAAGWIHFHRNTTFPRSAKMYVCRSGFASNSTA